MKRTNIFHTKKIKEDNIIVEEERKYRSPFVLFFRRNGKLIFLTSLILSITIFLLAISYTISELKNSTVIEHVSNGTIITFDTEDNSIINGTPITKDYANKLFEGYVSEYKNTIGVVLKIKEVSFKSGTIVFYSDKTALIKYNDGRYVHISSVDNNYGVKENGSINKNATTKNLTGELKKNTSLGIDMLYLSDGSIEVTKGKTTIYVRNSDITSTDDKFYTNLSIVSVPIKEEKGKTYYSNGTIKDGKTIIVNNKRYNSIEEKHIHNNIKIIYYENGFAEIIHKSQSIIVEEKDHIIYDDNILEIIDNNVPPQSNIKDLIDIKGISLNNTNDTKVNYMIVLEETENYNNYNVNRLDPIYINSNVLINGSTTTTEGLKNNIKGTSLAGGLSLKNNTYLLYEGELSPLEKETVKLGLWISYENITNEYMNSAFIGTIKIYVESLK